MRFNLLAGAAAFALTLGAAFPALAADAIYDQAPEPPAPPAAVAGDWSGFYLGVYGGYNWLSSEINPGVDIDGIDGLTGGGFVGYNVQVDPNWVVGLEGMAGLNGAENNFGATTVEQGWDASLRARLGYTFDSSMLYGLAGVAGTKAEVSNGANTDTNTHLGWTVGGGFETMLTDNVSARAEYNYADYGEERYNLGATNPNVSLDAHTVKLGIGLKF